MLQVLQYRSFPFFSSDLSSLLKLLSLRYDEFVLCLKGLGVTSRFGLVGEVGRGPPQGRRVFGAKVDK